MDELESTVLRLTVLTWYVTIVVAQVIDEELGWVGNLVATVRLKLRSTAASGAGF